jgi:predicted MFS family arabinose efflux permease
MSFTTAATAAPLAPLTPGLVRILSIAAGATVANSYYNQPMVGLLSVEFGLGAGTVAMVPVLTQAGNAVGVFFLAPLGDRLERKSLILATLAALTVALVAAALSSSFVGLAVACVAVGLFATVTQQLVPMAVHLSAPCDRGRVLGVVTGGILIGILLARTVSGAMSDAWGWRSVFWFAAMAMLALGLVLTWRLPTVRPTADLSYARLLLSMWTLVRAHALLRRAVAIQFLIFAAFIGFWANLALVLLEPGYGLGATAAGLFALVGVCGALAAPLAGRFADRRGHAAVVTMGATLVVVAFAIFGLWQASIAALIVGILVLDVAVQASQVANQTMVYALDANARSRLNTVFMGAMLMGGAFGAGMAGAAYARFGWSGVCAFGGVAAAMALVLSLKRSV